MPTLNLPYHHYAVRIGLIALLWSLMIIPTGCLSRMPKHAPVPHDAVFVERFPLEGVRIANARDWYNEKYISTSSLEHVLAFYRSQNLVCEASSDTLDSQVEGLSAAIWICKGALNDDVSLLVYVMPQEAILHDMELIEGDDESYLRLPISPDKTDPESETVIIAEVSLYID